MNGVRKQRLQYVLVLLTLLAIVAALVLYALRQNISLFYTPSQIAQDKIPPQSSIRVGGMVVKGSLMRASQAMQVQFQITDYKKNVKVHYQGILPDLFREGQGVVVRGRLNARGELNAEEVLAKHDENYMPPEVRASLGADERKE